MIDFPPEFQVIVEILETQPAQVREAFHYCLCLMLVEIGHMRLVEQFLSESGASCRFETSIGEHFSIPRPPINQEQEAGILEVLREILEEEGLF